MAITDWKWFNKLPHYFKFLLYLTSRIDIFRLSMQVFLEPKMLKLATNVMDPEIKSKQSFFHSEIQQYLHQKGAV